MKYFTFTLTFLISFSLLSKTRLFVDLVEGSTDFEVKNAIKSGLIKTFSNLPDEFSIVENSGDINIKVTVLEGKEKLDVMAKTSGDFITSEKVSGEATESFILGKILAIRLAKSIVKADGRTLTKDQIKQLAGSNDEQNSKRLQIIVIPFAGKGMKLGALDLITSEVRNILAKNDRLEVKDKKFMQTQMIDSGLTKKQCEDLSCQIELAGALGVDEAVTGEIVNFDGITSLSLKRVNIVDSSIKGSVSERFENKTLKELLSEIDRLLPKLYSSDVQKIMNAEIGQTDPPALKESYSKKADKKSNINKARKGFNSLYKDKKFFVGASFMSGLAFKSGFEPLESDGWGELDPSLPFRFGLFAELELRKFFISLNLDREILSFSNNFGDMSIHYNNLLGHIGYKFKSASAIYLGYGYGFLSSSELEGSNNTPTNLDISEFSVSGINASNPPQNIDLSANLIVSGLQVPFSLGYRHQFDWIEARLELRYYSDLFLLNFSQDKVVNGDSLTLIYLGISTKYELDL